MIYSVELKSTEYGFNMKRLLSILTFIFIAASVEATSTLALDGKLNENLVATSYVTPQMFGAKGDGVSDDSAAIIAAEKAAKKGVDYPPGAYRIAKNMVLTNPAILQAGAYFYVDPGKTLTLNTPVYAGSKEFIFRGPGMIAGTFGGVELWAEWFGVTSDGNLNNGGGTDNGPLINKAIAVAKANRQNVRVGSGVFRINSPVVIPSGVSLTGAGRFISIITCDNSYAGNVVLMNGNGVPSSFAGFGVVSQSNGAFRAIGINNSGNGTSTHDVWVGGFGVGIKMNSTDQVLYDWVCEYNSAGILVSATDSVISLGETYNNVEGVVVDNSGFIIGGPIVIQGVRSRSDRQSGFVLRNATNVIISGCSAYHEDNSKYSVAAMTINGASSNIQINSFNAKLAQVSTSASGIIIRDKADRITLSGNNVSGFKDGIVVATTGIVNIQGGFSMNNHRHGLNATAFDLLSISGMTSCHNGTKGVTNDAGFYISLTGADQRVNLTGNSTAQGRGGFQDHGIYINAASATSYANLTGNTNASNAVGQITVTGANAANVVQTGNH